MKRFSGVFCLILCLLACGGKNQNEQPEKTTLPQQQGGKIELASEEKLQGLLPEMEGWERDEQKYSADLVGSRKSARISVLYHNGERKVELIITDSGTVSALLSNIRMALAMNLRHQDKDGYEMIANFGGFRGLEKYRQADGHTEIALVIKDRYLIELKGDKLEKEELRTFLSTIPLADI